MKSYTSTTDPSTGGPRSPLFGTATFSSLSNTQTPLSPSRLSSSDRTYTAIGSNDDSDDASSERQMRRIVVSPPPTRDSDTYSYSDDNSIDDAAEVEAALSMIDTELANTEDALTQWSRGSSSVGTYSSYTDTATGAGTSTSYISTDYQSATNTPLDRDRRVLSTISERTENQSRPTSFAQSGGAQGSRPTTQYTAGDRRSGHIGSAVSPSPHVRAATEPSGAHTPGRVLNVPGRRAGELIAFFEDKGVADPASPHSAGHTRTTSVPMGPRSPSPYTTTHSRSMSTLGYTSPTSYGYGSTTGYGNSSRPSSPTKSRTGTTASSSDPITTMSSLLSPPHRGSASLSDSRLQSGTAGTTTQTSQTRSTGTYSGSSTYTPTFTSSSYGTITATPTASSLRRPQTSPRIAPDVGEEHCGSMEGAHALVGQIWTFGGIIPVAASRRGLI
ncbi:hypothetical protein A0H81_03303 [Grifola frondosa]|uniref:Uncharacterized protein n=1 Tax=Grifola frondosa TaxID=5627 RepID=A0A1C7MNX0_GRIFR|nr:hypothetical protein A0H81_03303 [Grifola frondosa]